MMNHNDSLNEYSLVYRYRPRTIMKLGKRFFYEAGKAKGVLIKRICWHGETWYHLPEDYLEWKYAKNQPAVRQQT